MNNWAARLTPELSSRPSLTHRVVKGELGDLDSDGQIGFHVYGIVSIVEGHEYD